MSVDPVIEALALPVDARVDRRVPKKLLLEQGAPTAADKRRIQDGIEDMTWIAALKPTNIAVPIHRDDVREYLEIAVLSATLRPNAKAPRLIELIHRAIPYPLLLVTSHAEAVCISLAHKRWSQGEAGKVVIEELHQTVSFRTDVPSPQEARFLASLALSALPGADLFALYQGWLDRVAALEAASITGAFVPPEPGVSGAALRESLEIYARLKREITALRAQTSKEKQLNRRVELNLQIQRLETELARFPQQLLPQTIE